MIVFPRILLRLVSVFFVLAASLSVTAQSGPQKGALEVSGRVKIAGKQEKLTRKRFYLLRGGLAENRALLDRIKTAEITSRNCYYTDLKASPQFICWLDAGDCESPFCRDATAEDIERVPEFKAAYQKGITAFRGKTNIARDWLTSSLPVNLVSGFYTQRRSLVDKLLTGVKPLQSSMTDTVTVKAIFIDIPVTPSSGSKTDTFLVSNILPMEVGDKSYVWSCEVNIDPVKTAKLTLQVPEPNKTIRNCEVVVRDLRICKTGACGHT